MSDTTEQLYPLTDDHFPAAPSDKYEALITELNDTYAQRLKDEVTQHDRRSEESFAEQLSKRLLEKEEELTTVFELRIAQSNLAWENKLNAAVEGCQTELISKHESDLKQLSSLYSEEMDNAKRACQIACDDQVEALKCEHKTEHEAALTECETALRAQLSEQLTSLENALTQRHREEIRKLSLEKDVLSRLVETNKADLVEEIVSLQAKVNDLEESQLAIKNSQSETLEIALKLKEQESPRNSRLKSVIALRAVKLRQEFSDEKANIAEDHLDTLAQVHADTAVKNALKVEQLSIHFKAERERTLGKQVHADTSVKNASKLEQLRYHFEAERERALVKHKEQALLQHHQTASDNKSSPAKKGSPLQSDKFKMDTESEISYPVSGMVTESKCQLNLLKENYELELTQAEQQIRAQLDDEHNQHMERVIADCTREKEESLNSLKQELEKALQDHVMELESSNQQHTIELENIQAQHSNSIHGLQSKRIAEIESLKSQLTADHDSSVEQFRAQLIQEHVTKFKEMTENLQRLHQEELDSLETDRESVWLAREQDLLVAREELEAKHEEILSELTRKQKQELDNLHELYDSRLKQREADHAHRIRTLIEQREAIGVEQEEAVQREMSNFNQDLERKLLILDTERQEFMQKEQSLKEALEQVQKDYQNAVLLQRKREEVEKELRDAVTIREHKAMSLKTELQDRDRQLIGLNEHHNEQIRLVEKEVTSQLNQLQGQLHTAVTERDEQLALSQSLMKEKDKLLGTVHKLKEDCKHLSLQASPPTDRGTSEADSATLNRLTSELSSLRAERDLLQMTVTTLHRVIISSLEITSVIDAVLESQPLGDRIEPVDQSAQTACTGPLAHAQARVDTGRQPVHLGDNLSALPERLLGSQVMSEGNECDELFNDGSTPTPHSSPLTTSVTPHSSPLTTSVSTSTTSVSSASRKTSTDWTDLKQHTPSMDSGVMSQQTSAIHSEGSTFTITPISVSGSNIAAAAPSNLTTPSHDIGSTSTLSVIPLEDTLPFDVTGECVHHEELPDALNLNDHSFLSVSLMTVTGSPTHGHQDGLDEYHDDTLQSLIEQALFELSTSVLPVDQTSLSYEAISGDPRALVQFQTTTSPPDLASLNDRVVRFRNSIATLLRRYAALMSQVKPSSAQTATISHLQAQLRSLSLRSSDVQADLDENQSRASESELKIKLQEQELTAQRDELAIAGTQIKTLVRELEEAKTKISKDPQSRMASSPSHHDTVAVHDKTKFEHLESELEGKERLLEQTLTRNERLAAQVLDLTSKCEESQCGIESLTSEVLQTRQESQTLKDVNRQLRGQQEQQDIKLHSAREQITQLTSGYQTELRKQQQELQDLMDIKTRLAAKEESEEKLISEKEELATRLTLIEHQFATLAEERKLADVGRNEKMESAQREENLVKELRAQSEVYEALRESMETVQSNLLCTQQELGQTKSSKSQLQLELRQLCEELQRKETSLQSLFSEKVNLAHALETCREETGALREELEVMSARKEEVESRVHQLEAQLGEGVEQRQVSVAGGSSVASSVVEKGSALSDQEKVASTLQQQVLSLEQALEIRSRELEDMTSFKIRLEDDVASLEGVMKDKEEDHHSKITNLEQELSNLRRQLTEQVKDLQLKQSLEESEVKINQLERLVSDQKDEVSDLTHKLSLEMKLKESQTDEVTTLHAELERGQRSRERELAEVSERHDQQLQIIVTEHAQKLNELQLAHLEALYQQRGDLDSQHAGEMAFVKLQLQEEIEELQIKHNAEVERLVSGHNDLMSAYPSVQHRKTGTMFEEDYTSDSLLMKIAKLAPMLAREALEVNELCKVNSQRQPPTVTHRYHVSHHQLALGALADKLKEVVKDIGTAKDSSGVEDWRKELLLSVENLLEHERDLLTTTLSASSIEREGEDDANQKYRSLLQDQLSQHTILLQQLHNADRESLLAEIRELRATLEEMRREQKQQSQELLKQFKHAQPGQPPDTGHLNHQLNSAHSALSQLELELSNKTFELANKEREKKALETDLEAVTGDKNRLRDDLLYSQERMRETEGLLEKATAISTSEKESQSTNHHGSSAYDHQSANHLNSQLLAEIESLNNRLASSSGRLLKVQGECLSLRQTITQLQSKAGQANRAVEELQLGLQEKQNEMEALLSRETKAVLALKTTLQSKELQLTQATDQMLREKLISSKARNDVSALENKMSTYETEIDSYRQQIGELQSLREQLDSLRRDYQDTGLKLEMSELERRHLAKTNKEANLNHLELTETLKLQLQRSKLLQSSLSLQQSADEMDVKELLEKLLHQEHLQSLSNKTAQADKEHLERQIRGLKKEIEDWKHLAKTPMTGGVSSIYACEAPTTSPLHDVVTVQRACHHEQAIENANSKIAHLYIRYRQAETHRKALVFQKQYLLCQVDAFFQTQQAALLMMADMGIQEAIKKPHCSKHSLARARFRAVGHLVLATLRFQYVRRRKNEYLHAKISRLSPPPSNAIAFGLPTPVISTLARYSSATSMPNGAHKTGHTYNALTEPHVVAMSTAPTRQQPHDTVSQRKESSGDPPVNPNGSTKTKQRTAQQPHLKPVKRTTGGKASSSHKILHATPTSTSVTQSAVNVPSSKHSRQDSHKPRVRKPNSSSVSPHTPVQGDPQLLAYMKGLERLQTRLSKANT